MSVVRQMKAFMTAAGVVTVIVMTQVNTIPVIVFAFVVICMLINSTKLCVFVINDYIQNI